MGKLNFFVIFMMLLVALSFSLKYRDENAEEPSIAAPSEIEDPLVISTSNANKIKSLNTKIEQLSAVQNEVNRLQNELQNALSELERISNQEVVIDQQALQSILNQLQVPPEDQVPITDELRRQGYRLTPSQEKTERFNEPVRPPIDTPHEG